MQTFFKNGYEQIAVFEPTEPCFATSLMIVFANKGNEVDPNYGSPTVGMRNFL